MIRAKHLFILSIALLSSHGLRAQRGAQQDTVIKGATIEIIQSYKPEVQRAPKPDFTPYLPPLDTTTPELRYSVPPQTLDYTYSSLPLRPLALDISPQGNIYKNYAKLGGGTLSTLYADAGIGSLSGEHYETAIHLNHLSQSGKIANQKVSATGLDAAGKLHAKQKIFGAGVGVHTNTYHYYGYDHNAYNFAESAVKQNFTAIDLGVDMQNEPSEVSKVNYHPSLKLGLFSDKYNASETAIDFKLPVGYQLDDNTELYIAAGAQMNAFSSPLMKQNSDIFSIAPGIRFNTNNISGHASVAPTFGNSNFYILPDININFTLPETQLMFSAGWKGELQQNTYRQLSTINPYISNLFAIQQTQQQEVYLGVKSNIGEHITFNGRASWWSFNNLPVFVNDTLTDNKQFFVLFDNKVNAIGLQAAIRYQVAQTFSIGFSGQWMNFNKSSYERVYHRPGLRFTGDIAAQPIEHLTINAYISFVDELYALDKGNRTFKLNSVLDIGLGAEYEIIDRLSIFARANNLLNNKNQLWYGYDAFGMNILGGARFKF